MDSPSTSQIRRQANPNIYIDNPQVLYSFEGLGCFAKKYQNATNATPPVYALDISSPARK
jgi:hypothetical protein